MEPLKPNPNSLALAGEFAVLSQLALRGYDANLTLGNTKGVDILVSDPRSGDMFRLEVKTSGHRNKSGDPARRSKLFGYTYQWMMSRKHEEIVDPRLFYCFVLLDGDEGTSFRFFVVPSGVVARYVREQHEFWLRNDPRRKDNALRNFRLALEDDGYPVETPSAARYEGNWTFER